MDNKKNQEIITQQNILESLKGLVVSNGTISFDEKDNNKKTLNFQSDKEIVNIIVAGKTGVGKSSLIN